MKVCSHQHKAARDFQNHHKTEEFDAKSLGVMAGERLMFYFEPIS